MSSSPESQWLSLTIRKDHIDEAVAAAAFSALKPIAADFITRGRGEWQGFDINTGHPTGKTMLDLHWAGKTFRNNDDVDPIMVYDKNGERKWSKDWGHAQLREINFDGTNTSAMVYDDFPIIDYFHFVDEDMVAGAMDSKKMKPFGTYYFYLKRI